MRDCDRMLRTRVFTIAISAAAMVSGVGAQASDELPVVEGPWIEAIVRLDLQIWEEGGWNTFEPGDELQFVGWASTAGTYPLFFWDPLSQYTVWGGGFHAVSDTVNAYGSRVRSYSAGSIEIREEPLGTPTDFGILPPNATSPSMFQDGELILGGTWTAQLVLAPDGRQFMYLDGDFDRGRFLNQYLGACGYCELFGDYLRSAGPVPDPLAPIGYDFGIGGYLMNVYSTAVENRSWGSIKTQWR